jgi:hypothetical protein
MKDIAVQQDGDIYISDEGDISIANTTDYHKKNVLLAKPGDFKHIPEVGVHIRNYINSHEKEGLLRRIKKNFLKIGLTVVSLRITNNILKEKSYYNEE